MFSSNFFKLFNVLLMVIFSLLVICCKKNNEPQIQLPPWQKLKNGNITFLSVYVARDGGFVDMFDSSNQYNIATINGMPIIATTFSYSFVDKESINIASVRLLIEDAAKNYSGCQKGIEITNIYKAKASGNKYNHVVSGFCYYK